MKNRATFTPASMLVVEGSVALELHPEDGHRLLKAFKYAGSWYIRMRHVTFVGGNIYAGELRTPA